LIIRRIWEFTWRQSTEQINSRKWGHYWWTNTLSLSKIPRASTTGLRGSTIRPCPEQADSNKSLRTLFLEENFKIIFHLRSDLQSSCKQNSSSISNHPHAKTRAALNITAVQFPHKVC
jgi:hypothetical protein